jgi:hypothetical protein
MNDQNHDNSLFMAQQEKIQEAKDPFQCIIIIIGDYTLFLDTNICHDYRKKLTNHYTCTLQG